MIGFVEEFSDFLEITFLCRDPLLLSLDICVDDHNDTAACHFFDWLIGVDIINSTCFGINKWTGPCTGPNNYAELR